MCGPVVPPGVGHELRGNLNESPIGVRSRRERTGRLTTGGERRRGAIETCTAPDRLETACPIRPPSRTTESHSQPAVSARSRPVAPRDWTDSNLQKPGNFGADVPSAALAVVLPLIVAVNCLIQVLNENNVRTVSVAGRLADAHIPDLMLACGECSAALRVDLTDVVSTDTIAVEALRRICDGGAQLVGVPMYLQIKLDSLAPRPRAL
jgi:hypothetical protein